MSAQGQPLTSWLTIIRLGLVQTALGAIVVLTTSTINRIMVVELAMPAMLPGVLVAMHYFVQMARPRLGHGSDVGGNRTRWIVLGVWVLAVGGVLAAFATNWLTTQLVAGVVLAVIAFLMIGLGVGAAGTSLLTLVATSVAAERRAPAATIMWVMMIAGFIVTTAMVGRVIDPYSGERLIQVTCLVAGCACLLAMLAVWGIEPARADNSLSPHTTQVEHRDFRTALTTVWRESQARRFTIFVFVSMLAYSAQDLILEPFAGLVFAMSPGQSTRLSSLQNGGVLIGMVWVALLAPLCQRRFNMSLRQWTIVGCVLSALGLLGIASAGLRADVIALKLMVGLLGFGNGMFAVSAIGRMMDLANDGAPGRAGVRMGLWGAAQAVAFGLGSVVGALGVDVARHWWVSPLQAYGSVFVVEALLFVLAAYLAQQTAPALHAHGTQVVPTLATQGDSYHV